MTFQVSLTIYTISNPVVLEAMNENVELRTTSSQQYDSPARYHKNPKPVVLVKP